MDLDLDEIRRATEAATEGPWEYGDVDSIAGGSLYGGGWMIASVDWENDLPRSTGSPLLDSDFRTPAVADANGAFIAGARSWVPALVAEVERLRAALAYLFDVWLPLDHCNGPRDCAGTVRGCTHCCPDATLDAARALLGESRG